MNWSATVRTIVLCAILIFLHYTLRPLLAWRASADFLIIALLIASVRVRPGVAAMFGFLLGLASDSLALGAFGAGALAMTLIGFSWSRLPQMIPLTAADRRMLALGSDQGIGEGFTVPTNVPGEARFSARR